MKLRTEYLKIVLSAGIALGAITSGKGRAAYFEVMPADDCLSKADQQSVHGKVTDKKENSLTVDGKTIAISSATMVYKDGTPASLMDVALGNVVTITVRKSEEGGLQAMIIEIASKPEAKTTG